MVCTFPLKLSQTLNVSPLMGLCSRAPQRPRRCPGVGAVTGLHPRDVLSFLCHRMCFLFPLISVCSHFSFSSVLYSASRSLFFHPDLPIFLVLNFPVSGNVSISHRLFLLFPCPQAGPVQLASAFSSPEKTKTKKLLQPGGCLLPALKCGAMRPMLSLTPAPKSENQLSETHVHK